MPFGLVDDQLHSHVKWRRATKGARALWATALSWCVAQRRYDSRIPGHMLRYFEATTRDAESLVAAGLWERDGDIFIGHYRIPNTDRRPDIPRAVRTAVYERDGYACVTCGATETLSLDHIKPWSLGGPDTIDNLQTMCRPCNSSKGATY